LANNVLTVLLADAMYLLQHVEKRNLLLMDCEVTTVTTPLHVMITATQILSRDTHKCSPQVAGQVPHFELHQLAPQPATGMPFSRLLTAPSAVEGTYLNARLPALEIYMRSSIKINVFGNV
jgi:hypothetical protein